MPSQFNQPYTVGMCPRALALLVVVLVGGFAQQTNASNGGNGRVPFTRTGKPAYSKQSGLQILVDSTWAGNRGYRPIVITATMATPATADTQITIEFHAGGWGYNQYSINVEADFEFPLGASTATTKVLVPQYADWSVFGWEVWVDGVKDEELCVADAGFNAGNSGTTSIGVFRNSASLTHWFGGNNRIGSARVTGYEIHPLTLANLPDRWIAYSSLDVVATTNASLQLLRVTSPKKLTELLRWVRAGGNLWVMDCNQDFSELSKLEGIFRPYLGDQTEVNSKPLKDWHFLEDSENGRPRLNDLLMQTMQIEETENALLFTDRLNAIKLYRDDDPDHWWQKFVVRNYGMGTVAAWRDIEVAGGMSLYGGSSISQNLDWGTRHGNDPAGGNPNFNNWLIPDVGAAPVFEFQLLISLFVIGIGPVNYWLLKRRNQLPLLLVTVPAAALAATLLLFSYGFLADGVGVRVRVRSMTMLDQRAGEMASWARMSYYAGIAPSDGLEMPANTTLYPILPSRSGINSFGRRTENQQRSIEWSQQQHLTRGWLGSRTPTQYLAVTASPSKKQLIFKSQPDQLSVTNQLGTQVLALVVQDHEGNIFVGDQIDTEGTVTLSSSTYIKGASTLRKFLAENLPQLPAGYIESKTSRRSLYGSGNGGNLGVPMTDSLMELHFEAIVSPAANGWGNGTYVAVTATGIEVPLGVEGATETSSFHVVRGTW